MLFSLLSSFRVLIYFVLSSISVELVLQATSGFPACLLAHWLKHARSLTLLPDWRHTMPSGWFMTPVAHRHSCCETPLPSASIWEFVFLHRGVSLLRLWPSKTGFAWGCSALTCRVCIALFIDCALGPCCLPLTVSLCVCLVQYDQLIVCHWHWFTPRASSELVIMSICPPTAQAINI